MTRTRKNIHNLIAAAKREIPVEEQFLDDFTNAIVKLETRSARIPSKFYKPSSMRCVRNMYYQRTGQAIDPSDLSPELAGILQSGTDRHDRLQGALAKMADVGFDLEFVDVAEFIKEKKLTHLDVRSKEGYETKLFHNTLDISFMCDGILKFGGEYYVLEIKTESQYKWMNREAVAEEHLAQATTYGLAFGIDKVIFLYENRDNCAKKAYIIEITEDMKYSLVIDKIELCDSYVDDLVPPPKPKEANAKFCQYCNYKSQCKMDGK